jgi:two-component system nitrogen regulation response regulator GlnG
MKAVVTDSTISSGGLTSGPQREKKVVPALTIIWHPDVRRVGEVAPLEPLGDGARAELTRLTPTFARPGDDGGEPLGDPHLSRTSPAVVLSPGPQGAVVLAPGADGRQVEVDGESLDGPLTVTSARLRRGVVLTVARRVVLCLHTVQVPVVRGPLLGLVGGGDGIEQVRDLVRQVADLNVSVLIRGETGAGKELVARAIVDASPRARKPFIAVNVAAIPASTAAAELFGHERGAFTGAAGVRPGYFGESAGGTLFLDEIGLAPADLQALLLRVLETGEIVPLGASRPKKADVRLVAATDADLERAVLCHQFSEPLFQRLAGCQISLPPLRDRREDFGDLFLHFFRQELLATGELDRLSARDPQEKPWLRATDVATLARGSWPGNVRALRNAVRQIVIASRGQPYARIDDAVMRLSGGFELEAAPDGAVRPTVEDDGASDVGPIGITNEKVLAALREHRWRPSAAAAALGVPRTTLYALMDRHPLIRKASEIPAAELREHYEATRGDLDAMVERLQVSRRALQLRLTRLLSESAGRNASRRSRLT